MNKVFGRFFTFLMVLFLLFSILTSAFAAGSSADDRTTDLSEGMKKEYPAVSFSMLSSNNIRVKVSAPEGAFPEGTAMSVTAVGREEVMEILEGAADTVHDVVADAAGVDIIFIYEGEEIEPLKEISVSLSHEELKGEEFAVYHVGDLGEVEEVAAETDAVEAVFESGAFSIYIVARTVSPEEETAVSVTYNFYNRKGIRLFETETYENLIKKGETWDIAYDIPEITGKNASIRSDSDEGFTLTDGKLSASLDGSSDEYVINLEYSAAPADYTVKYLFQNAERTGYEEDSSSPAITVSSEVNEITDVRAPSVKGFIPLPVEQQIVREDSSTVVTVYFDRAEVALYYDTDNGTHVDTKYGFNGSEFTVYAGPLCGKEEHKHDGSSAGTPSNSQCSNGTVIGCYKAAGTKYGSYWYQKHWELVCGKDEHTHTDDCYEPTSSKVGYTFDGWYLDKDMTRPAPEKMTLSENTTVYAKWTPVNVNYSIVVQKENLDGTYSYVGHMSKEAPVGSTVSVTTDPRFAFTDSAYYHFAGGTSATVKADGTTVVYLNYALSEYTFEFDLRELGENATMTMGGTVYYKDGPRYQYKAKLGQDISTMWPTAGDFTNASFYSWDSHLTKRIVLAKDLIYNSKNGSTTTYKAVLKEGTNLIEAHYWLENADDNNYTDSPVYRQNLWVVDGLNPKEIEGFSSSKVVRENGRYDFYYDRLTFDIAYMSGGDVWKEISSIKFDKDISSFEYQPTPAGPPNGMEGYSFGGWYESPNCEGNPYIFSTMPASNLILYAKWLPPLCNLYVDLNYDDISEHYEVPRGSFPQEYIETPSREGYDFLGWYTSAEGGFVYDITQPIDSDVTIYAHYKKIERTRYTVYYEDRAGLPVAAPVTYDSIVGDTVREEAVIPAEAYSDYVVDEDVKFRKMSFNEADNAITFVYTDLADIQYGVKYILEDGSIAAGGEEKWQSAGAKQKVVKADPDILNKNPGYSFEASEKWLDISSDESKNLVIFTLVPAEYLITYKNVDDDWASAQVGSYNTKDTIALNRPAPENGYSFIGWNFTSENGVVQTADHSRYNTVISPGSYGDLEFTAQWAKLAGNDLVCCYDGNPHSIDAAELIPGSGKTLPSGYEITYSFEEDGTYTTAIPTKTDVGEYKVYIKAEKEDYGTLTTTAILKIEKVGLAVRKVSDVGLGGTGTTTANLGQTITYTVTVENTGNVTIKDIIVKDELPGAVLAAGESDTIASLEPGMSKDVHFTYVVTEADLLAGRIKNVASASGIDPFGKTTEGKAEWIDYTDDPTGDLTVSKTISGNAAESGRMFSFTVTLSDTAVNGSYGDMSFTNGVAVFSLKGGESKTAKGLPAAAGYTVVEADYSADGYETAKSGDTGTIAAFKTVTAAFTNTKNVEYVPTYGNLTISKNVTGDGGDATKSFTFTVQFNVDGTFNYTGSKTGTISSGGSVLLKHGETITIVDIPSGTLYSVTESDNSGYEVYASGDTGIISDGETSIAAFINSRGSLPETGENSNLALWLSLMGLSVLGLAGILFGSNKKHKRVLS